MLSAGPAFVSKPRARLYALTVIGLLEELVKFVPFWLVGMRLRAFDEPIDGIIYASFVALGFATAENFSYSSSMDGWPAIAPAVATPIVHCLFASVWGYTCSRARMSGKPLLRAAFVGLVIAAAAHGLYDFAAILGGDGVALLPLFIVLVIWMWRMVLIKRLHVEQGHQ